MRSDVSKYFKEKPLNKHLIKRQFKNSIRLGTGAAYLLIKKYPLINFTKEIIYCATHNLAYDQQCEPSRARYIYEIICQSVHKDKIANAVLSELLIQKNNSYDLNQMCEIAVLCVLDGNQKARKIIYKRFEKNLLRGYTYCGNSALLEMDGMDGLLRIANLIGQILQRDPNDWEDGSREDYFQKEHPDIDVYKCLENAAKTNLNIKTYLNSIKENKRHSATIRERKPYTYASVKEIIEHKDQKPVLSFIVRDLGKDDFIRLAKDFLQEDNPENQEQYLRIFAKYKFPLSYEPLLEIVIERRSKKTHRFFFAIQALSHFKADKIRTFVIGKLRTVNNAWEYLPLLERNYKKGDSQLLYNIISKTNNNDHIHNIADALVDIYNTNSTKDCKRPILAIYRKLTCSLHREYLIKILLANDILSKQMRNEINYDCNVDSRKLVE
jgi:hypothetical protein